MLIVQPKIFGLGYSMEYASEVIVDADISYKHHRAECCLRTTSLRRDRVFFLETHAVYECNFNPNFLESLLCMGEQDLLRRIVSSTKEYKFETRLLEVLYNKVDKLPSIPIPIIRGLYVARSRTADIDINELEQIGILRTPESFAGMAT